MSSKRFKYVLGILLAVAGFLFLPGHFVIAQVAPDTSGPVVQHVEILNADVFEFTKINGAPIRKLLHNVHMRQDSTDFFCDSAYHYVDTNFVIAYGHVKILMGDSVIIHSDLLTYDGQTKICKLNNHVHLIHGKSNLKTDKLTWYRTESYGYYEEGGTLYDGENELTSETGYYYSREHYANFKTNVELLNPKYILHTDTLGYDTELETAHFLAPTHVYDTINVMYTERGYYDTKNNKALLHQEARVGDTAYTLFADTIYYDRDREYGEARGHIIAMENDPGLTVYGKYADFRSAQEETRITGDPYGIEFMDDDTLFLFADTLHTASDSTIDQRMFRAYHNVEIYMRKMQGKSDSLVYYEKDSMFQFFKSPVMWSDANQILGDSIHVFMRHKKLDSLSIIRSGFMISQEDTSKHNQIKGKYVRVKFEKSEIRFVWVNTNSETMYWVRDDDSTFMGLNVAKSNELFMEFREGKPYKIVFRESPTGTFFPYHERMFEENKLEGFKWMPKDRPERPDSLIATLPSIDSLLAIIDSLHVDSLIGNAKLRDSLAAASAASAASDDADTQQDILNQGKDPKGNGNPDASTGTKGNIWQTKYFTWKDPSGKWMRRPTASEEPDPQPAPAGNKGSVKKKNPS